MRLYGGYIGIMEKKMETSMVYYIPGYSVYTRSSLLERPSVFRDIPICRVTVYT